MSFEEQILIGHLRFEYEIEYNFSILICRLHIIMSHTGIPISFHELPSLPQSNINRMALEMSLV